MTYFLDFDRTLFDTDAFVAHLMRRPDAERFLRHESESALAATLNALAQAGEVAFVPGELKPFMYPDVSGFISMAENDVAILTFGNSDLQRLKIENVLAGAPPISVFYTGDTMKGAYMKDWMGQYEHPVFVDDMPAQLEDMAAHCPQVQLFEMRRDGGAGDGRWPVIRSLTELP